MRRADRTHHGLDLEHHARPAAVGADRPHGAVRIRRMRARIFRTDSHEPAFRRPPEDAEIDRAADHVRKQRDHLDVHRAYP